MAKRYTATEKWLDPWFCALPNDQRLFWIYLLDNCDHAGIWQVNMMLVHTYFGPTFALPDFGDRIIKLAGDKWFIPKFLHFQYGVLDTANRVHASVLAILEKEGVCKDRLRTVYGPKDKDKDSFILKIDTKDHKTVSKFTCPSLEEVRHYCEERKALGKPSVDAEAWLDHYSAKGWKIGMTPMKDWKAAIRTWERSEKVNGGLAHELTRKEKIAQTKKAIEASKSW